MSKRPYKASWWLRGGHAQTLWPALVRKVPIEVRTERLDLPDGEVVQLDWVGDAGPIVIVLPGLQGDLQSPYVRGLLRACRARGWRGVLLHHRGRPEPSTLPRSYHCGMTCDLDHLVRRLREQEPDTPLGVVGYSLGANICLKWLGDAGQRGEPLPIAAAALVSTPFDLGSAARKIERGFSRLYQRHLLRSLYREVERKMAVCDMGLALTSRELRTLNTFYKFDNRITGPLNGFRDADDYYARTRTDALLRHVAVPTLVVNARNDPLVPAEMIPREHDISEQVTLEITDAGGHMGFVAGRWPWSATYWLDTRLPAYLAPYF